MEPGDRSMLLDLARTAVHAAIERGAALSVPLERYAAPLRRPGASFVSLHCRGALRGCVGSIEPYRPLVADVAGNALAAALRDTRFPRLQRPELRELALSLHLLTPLAPIRFGQLAELHAALRVGTDGVVLELGTRRGVFLPVMWEHLPRPEDFVDALLRKAGIDPRADLSALRASRFEVTLIEDAGAAHA